MYSTKAPTPGRRSARWNFGCAAVTLIATRRCVGLPPLHNGLANWLWIASILAGRFVVGSNGADIVYEARIHFNKAWKSLAGFGRFWESENGLFISRWKRVMQLNGGYKKPLFYSILRQVGSDWIDHNRFLRPAHITLTFFLQNYL